jgi:hypothetical protein
VQLELGDTSSMMSTYDNLMVEKMFPILKDLGVEANLLGEMELRDSGDNFKNRLDLPVPSVLSNVYPLEAESDYAKLKQFHKTQLQGGVNVYFLNLFDVDYINEFQNIKSSYEPIDMVEFVEKFAKQVNPRDILVATVNFRKPEAFDAFMASTAVKKIDLLLIPGTIGRDYFLEEEKILVSNSKGWDPTKIVDTQPPVDLSGQNSLNQPGNEPPKPGGESKVDTGKSTDTDTGADNENKDTENKESSNQGGTKVDEGQNPDKGDNSDKGGQDKEKDKQSNLQQSVTVPPGSRILPPAITPGSSSVPSVKIDKIDLTFKDREFLQIKNEYHAVPCPVSAEYLREIHFKQTPNGEIQIEVADLIIDSRYPEDPEIKKISDETTEKVDKMRMLESVLKRAGNIRMQVNNMPENPYIGSAECQKCHTSIYETWQASSHAKALQSLKKKSAQANDQCLKCHVTQWTQPEWYTRTWTFDGHSEEIGCESCHGPGKGHILLVNTITDPQSVQFWDDVVKNEPTLNLNDISTDAKAKCIVCHDQANSPTFDFVEYWTKIEHKELDKAGLRDRLTSAKGANVSQSVVSPLTPTTQNGQRPPAAPTTRK